MFLLKHQLSVLHMVIHIYRHMKLVYITDLTIATAALLLPQLLVKTKSNTTGQLLSLLTYPSTAAVSKV